MQKFLKWQTERTKKKEIKFAFEPLSRDKAVSILIQALKSNAVREQVGDGWHHSPLHGGLTVPVWSPQGPWF